MKLPSVHKLPYLKKKVKIYKNDSAIRTTRTMSTIWWRTNPKKEHTHDNNKGPAAGQKEDPLKEFVHAHDGDEEATFFVQSIRAKLKAAVTIMWTRTASSVV